MDTEKKLDMRAGKIECNFCGAWFDEKLPACPYCGSTNIKGAEAEYMDKLEDIREDMEDLGSVPLQETKKALKKQTIFVLAAIGTIIGFFICLILIEVLFGYKEEERDPKADYLWQQENFPILDELYEQEKYEELAELFVKAYEEKQPISAWEHWEFASAIDFLLEAERILAKEHAGEELTKWDYHALLSLGFRINDYENDAYYTDDEQERMAPYIEMVRKDFETRWNFTEEEAEMFEKEKAKNYGMVPYEVIEEYIEDWMEGSGK